VTFGPRTLRKGDYVYGSPENTGDSMEVTRIKDMFDTGSKDDN